MADMTLAQLQALVEQQGQEIAKLKAAAAATTPAPTEYYTLTKTGEEIDAILAEGGGGGVAGAVRYDEAQSLTTDQQAQARSNIGAAPSGYGLGENYTKGPMMTLLTAKTIDTTYNNGWYFANEVNIAGFKQATIRVDSSGRTIYQTAYIAQRDDYVLRRCLPDTIGSAPANSFGPWEWVNPPMELGVEYRTTERYRGKPVYVKLVNCGAGPNATEKRVEHGVSNALIIDFGGVMLLPVGSEALSIPWLTYSTLSCSSTEIAITSTANYSGYTAQVWIKYCKTTD